MQTGSRTLGMKWHDEPDSSKLRLPTANYWQRFMATSEQAAQLSLNMVPGNLISRATGEAQSVRPPRPIRLFGPDGLALPATGTGQSGLTLSKFNRFLQNNIDLISIIDQDKGLLQRAVTTGFSTREDLHNLLKDEVLSKLSSDSPITDSFLRSNREVSALLAFNIGGLMDRVIQDETIATDLVVGQSIGDALSLLIATEAATLTGAPDGLDQAFFESDPLAAAFILDNPDELSRILRDTNGTATESLLARLQFTRSVIRTEVAKSASALLSNEATYSLTFLKQDERFSSLLVGASRLDGRGDLPSFLRTERTLSLERVNVSSLLTAYEARRASTQLPQNEVINEGFLARNVGLALVINRNQDVRDALIADLGRLEALSKPGNSRNRLTSAGDLITAYQEKASDFIVPVNYYL